MNKQSQNGVTLLLFLLLLLLASTLALAWVGTRQISNPAAERDRQTQVALTQAKNALLAWSVSRNSDSGTGVAESPAELPCPSPYAPGTPQEGQAAPNNCSHGAIGLLPWRQLGIERIVDGWGQPLWYVLDNAFKVRRNANETRLVNSDSHGTLQVYTAQGGTLLNSGADVAAIVISAGPPLSGQERVGYASGSLIDGTIRAAFLDSAFGLNNAQPGGPFIAGPVHVAPRKRSGALAVNDRLLILSGRELLDAAVPRLANTVRTALVAQRQETGNYPRPARIDALECRDNNADTPCLPAADACRGILPDRVPSGTWLPDWFRENQWQRSIYYALGSGPCAYSPISLAATSGLAAENGIAALFILPGARFAGQVRLNPELPAVTAGSLASNRLADYLEHNTSGWDEPDLLLFERPQPQASNDRLYILP